MVALANTFALPMIFSPARVRPPFDFNKRYRLDCPPIIDARAQLAHRFASLSDDEKLLFINKKITQRAV